MLTAFLIVLSFMIGLLVGHLIGTGV